MLIKNKKINIINLGCRVNSFESSAIAHDLENNGAIIVDDLNKSDICIINTCTVTAKADSKSKYFIRKACNTKNIKLVVVIGCYSQINEVNNDKAKIVVGTKYKNKIVELIKNYENEKIIKVDKLAKNDVFESFSQLVLFSNTRAFIKIQDGCNFMCSYCLIPFARGSQRSLNHSKVLELINNLIKHNYKEIVLTGVNTAGYNDGVMNFYELLGAINSMKGNFRVRISSIEPFQLNKKILDLILNNKNRWCQHLHICMQSANNEIIKDMNRRYTVESFTKLCQYIRSKNSLFSITTDYIVGYPTETNPRFNNSLNNLQKISFSDMHIFPYSHRNGTVASKIKSVVADAEKTKRFKMINGLKQN
jgi:threonylcarbamoyladenosine tRNA methylthiotransferase MtaB